MRSERRHKPEDRRFKSCTVIKLGRLSNWLARRTVNAVPSGLGGSSPSLPTTNRSGKLSYFPVTDEVRVRIPGALLRKQHLGRECDGSTRKITRLVILCL